jgi:hypothetical protein
MLRTPKRSAHASIGGYEYQFAYTALRWLQCQPGDSLICEGNEDVDHVRAGGLVEEVQLKNQRARLGAASRTVRTTLTNFSSAFCEHHAANRRCALVLVSTAELVLRGSSPLNDWLRGQGIRDLNQLAAEATRTWRLPRGPVAYLESRQAWREFFNSVTIKFGAPTLSKYRSELAARLATDPRTEGLDPDQVVASMTHRVLTCSGDPDVTKRVLRSLDLDILLNDIWLAKGVDQYGLEPGPREAYVAMTALNAHGRACVAVFLDDRDQTARSFDAACHVENRRPRAHNITTLDELCQRDRFEFVNGLGFDAYAVVDTRMPGSPAQDLVAQLIPYVSAREAPNVRVSGQALRHLVANVPESFPFQIVPAQQNEIGSSLATMLADAVVSSASAKSMGPLLASVARKIRVICDLSIGAYFTQAAPPPWAS